MKSFILFISIFLILSRIEAEPYKIHSIKLRARNVKLLSKNILILKGDVNIELKELTINCDTIKIVLKNNEIEKIVAEGSVQLKWDINLIKGNKVIIELKRAKIIIPEKVKIIRRNTIIVANNGYIDLDNKNLELNQVNITISWKDNY